MAKTSVPLPQWHQSHCQLQAGLSLIALSHPVPCSLGFHAWTVNSWLSGTVKTTSRWYLGIFTFRVMTGEWQINYGVYSSGLHIVEGSFCCRKLVLQCHVKETNISCNRSIGRPAVLYRWRTYTHVQTAEIRLFFLLLVFRPGNKAK